MSSKAIRDAKRRFLDRYNPARDVDVALSKAIKAAVQHNELYQEGVDYKQRAQIRGAWAAYLLRIAAAYAAIADSSGMPQVSWSRNLADEVPQFDAIVIEKDILGTPIKEATDRYYEFVIGLKSAMNDNFGLKFRDSGFRVSHSQKSISVFLKHLWCMCRIPMPLQCPVDRNILSCLPASDFGPWTRMNTLEEHVAVIAALNTIARPTPLAVWELLHFLPRS